MEMHSLIFKLAKLRDERLREDQAKGHVNLHDQQFNIALCMDCASRQLVRDGRAKNVRQARGLLAHKIWLFSCAHGEWLEQMSRDTMFDVVSAYIFYRKEKNWKATFTEWAKHTIPVAW